MSGSVSWITYAPVKGLALVHPQEVELTPAGVPGDRRFHLVDDRGRLAGAKVAGPLVQVRAAYDDAQRRLTLTFPDGEVVDGIVELGEPLVTQFWGARLPGRLVVGPWAEALSRARGKPLRLVEADRPERAVDRGREGAVTLLSTAALEPLAQRAGAPARDGRRFRMLFGIDGVEPHAEDGWIGREVRVGAAVVVPRGHVGRCLVTSRDPDTGAPDVDTLGALRAYRRDLDTTEPLAFGVFGEVRVPGRVALGDAVEPL